MKKITLLILSLVLLLGVFSAAGAETVTIGAGTTTGRHPLNDYFKYSRSQCIYLQSEIGVSNGLITKLRWYRNDTVADPNAIGTTEIWLTETASPTLSGTAWIDPGTLVATISNIDLGSSDGWYEIDIADYFYAGGNLLVSVRTQDAPYTTPHSYWRYTSTTPDYRMLAGNSDTVNPPNLSRSYSRPNIQMDIEPVAGYPGAVTNPNPANGATAISLSGTLSWDFGADTETYELYFGPSDNTVLVDSGPVTGPSGTWNYGPLSELTSYQWQVISHNSSKNTANGPVWGFTTLLTPLNEPVTEDFESITTAGTFPLGWTRAGTRWTSLTTVPTSNPRNRGPRSGTNYLTCQYSSSDTDWMFSPGVSLDATKTYDFGIWYNTDGFAGWTSFKMYIGTSASRDEMTELASVSYPVNMTYTQLSGNAWAPPATGEYYVGLQVLATSSPWYMSFDDFTIVETPTSPVFDILPLTWDFVDVDVNTTDSHTFTVSNIGVGALGITSIQKTAGDVDYFEVTNNSYTDPLVLGDSFTFDVEFSPLATGDYTLTITITDDQGKAAHDITITGNGYVRPAGSTCQNPYPVTLPLTGFTGDTSLYGNDYESTWVTPSSNYLRGDDMVLQFTLDAPSTLQGTLTAITGTWIGMIVVDTCPDPVNPAPILAIASSSGTVATFMDIDEHELPAGNYFLLISTWPTPNSFQFSLDLAAIPVSQDPIMTITEDYWGYGVAFLGLSNCTPHTFTATNTGKGIITIGAQPVISDPANFSIIGDTNQYPITLGANAAADWTVKFHPTVLCGEKIATMTIMDDMKRNITLVSHNESDVGFSFTKSLNGQTVSAKQAVFTVSKSGLAQPKESYAIGLRGFGNESVFEDYFETYTHLAQDLTPWTQYDGDATATYNLQVTVSGTSYTLVPQYTGSFIGLDYSSYVPEPGAAWVAYSGDKYAGCSAAIGQQNNDWLISPQLTFADNPRISFFAKSLTIDYGMENFMVLYSTTGNSYSDFAGNYLNPTAAESAPLDWTLFEYELPASCANTDVYLAIQCVSNDVFMLMIDDFVAGDEGGTPPPVPVELSSFTATLTGQCYVQLNWTSQTESQMMGYRVYRNTSTDQSTSITINQSLVPATNTSSTQTYSMVDNEVANGQTYHYWLEAVDFNSSSYHGPVSVTVNGDVPPVLPEITSMKNAYPNPFKASANIEVSLKAGETGTVTLYNVAGQTVRTFQVVEGIHNLAWDGKDSSGKACGSGIFFYRLTTPSFNQTRKLMFVK